jgi:hypothetical protein
MGDNTRPTCDRKVKARNWILTAWMPAECEDAEGWRQAFSECVPDGYDHALNLELTPTTERVHIQGFIKGQCRAARLYDALKPMGLGWLAPANSPKVALDYCTKTETSMAPPLIVGKPAVGQGSRTDIHDAVADLKAGATWSDMLDKHASVFVKHHSGLKQARFAHRKAQAQQDRPVKVVVLVGDAGTGKSAAAYRQGRPLHVLNKQPTGPWFDGYDGEKVLLLDDFYGWMPKGTLLNYLDRYPCPIPIKGGMDWALWDTVFITSNDMPEDWFSRDDGVLTPNLARRLHMVFELTNDAPPELRHFHLKGWEAAGGTIEEAHDMQDFLTSVWEDLR